MAPIAFTEPVGGRYEIGERLGSGGMSEVYAATDLRLGRRVAVKFLRSEVDDPNARARIESEARSAAALSHPNIVNVYDAGDHEERPYVVMELAESRSLADVIRDEGPLPVGRVRAIAAQVLAALTAAHTQGLVHRDVKPANILVADDGSVKLADFGIAKSFSDAASAMTAVGMVMGTPTYLSPEQAAGEPATPRSDLYAMGVVLYEALSGTPPFTGDTPTAVVAAHAHAPIPDIRAVAPAVPASIAVVVERALAKDPVDRYADAAQMARALEAGGGADPTRAVAITESGATTAIPVGASAPPPRPWLSAAMGGVAVVVFVLLLFLGLRGGTTTGDGNVGGVTSASVSTTATTAPTTAAPPALPQTLDGLVTLLDADPQAYGEKGPDLRDKLAEVMRFEGRKQAEEAGKLQEEIRKWADDGELDRAIADRAIGLLEPLAQRDGDGDGDGRGRGEEEDD